MRLVAIGALVAACSGPPASAPAAGSAAVAQPAARTASPDAAYLQLRGEIVAIESGAFRTIDGSEPVRGFVARPGGGGWFIHGGGIARYDGGGLVPLAGVPAQHEPRAAGPDGSLYTAPPVRGELARFDGTWHDVPAGLWANEQVEEVFVAADQTVYVVTKHRLLIGKSGTFRPARPPEQLDSLGSVAFGGAIYATTASAYVNRPDQLLRLDGGAFTVVTTLPADHGYRVRVSPTGAVFVFGATTNFELRGDKLVPIPDLRALLADVAFAPDGTLYAIPMANLVTTNNFILRRTPTGVVTRLPAQTDLPFTPSRVAVDGRGRAWLELADGFAIVDGDRITMITPHTVPELTSAPSDITITGNGPDLPPLPPPRLIRVAGTLVASGTPRAGVPIELCRRRSPYYTSGGGLPCAMTGYVRRTTTAADGTFALADVPLDGWSIYYESKPGGGTVHYFPPGCCTGVATGATFEMGEIEAGTP